VARGDRNSRPPSGGDERFVGEPLEPVPGTADAEMMSRGSPGLPREFTWRGRRQTVVEVLEAWRTTGACRHGSGEQYVRRHWWRIRAEPAGELTVYCDRQARGRGGAKLRWWVFAARPAPRT
jgi:phosphoribosylglycinamide formyltransferase-1